MSRGQADPATHAYRRRARRLRARLAGEPLELYRSLRTLAEWHDSERADSRPIAPSPTADRAARFATQVASQLDARLLRYSDRQKLVGRAERLGIGRFQANLIIAAVQHHKGETPSAVTESPRRPIIFRLAPVLTCLAVQLLIAAAAWGIFLR